MVWGVIPEEGADFPRSLSPRPCQEPRLEAVATESRAKVAWPKPGDGPRSRVEDSYRGAFFHFRTSEFLGPYYVFSSFRPRRL